MKRKTEILLVAIPLIFVMLFLTHDIIITHALAWWFCRSEPNPKTFVIRKVEKPGSIYFEDNVYPGYDERDRLNTITNYLDGNDLTTLALNDPEGNVHVYTATINSWKKSNAIQQDIRNGKYTIPPYKPKAYSKTLHNEAAIIAQSEKLYTKATMPKMNYSVIFNPVSLPNFWRRYVWADEITIYDNSTGEILAYNRRLLQRWCMLQQRIVNIVGYTSSPFSQGTSCGYPYYNSFDLKVFPRNTRINAPKHLDLSMPEPGTQKSTNEVKNVNRQK
ncbi:MAG: hypothetical protein LBU39_07050 [Desulfobulbaceae bacterium]|jgi:hypothetical protein|nr:hypothetical protein [Desulfobulbaceae bacterium]